MKCREIIKQIEQVYCREYAMNWDNVGLLVGDGDAETDTVLLALDATDDVIEQAVALGAGLIVTHHPLIFRGMKRITAEDFIGRRVMRLVQNGIACYAMHTNFDVGEMGREAARRLGMREIEILEVTGEADGQILGIGALGTLSAKRTVLSLAEEVKRAFSIDTVRIFGGEEQGAARVAIVPGSGGSDIEYALRANADVLITGDIDHHEGMDAVAQGLSVIDAGHYGLEHIFAEYMEEFLHRRLGDKIKIVRAKETAPFVVV